MIEVKGIERSLFLGLGREIFYFTKAGQILRMSCMRTGDALFYQNALYLKGWRTSGTLFAFLTGN
ncbi:hypothetical protein ACE4RR_19010 [Alteribacillus sp. HJP-4]